MRFRVAIAACALSVLACPALAETMQERATPCLACHGEVQSQTPEIPSLGGLPPAYVLAQLYMFREKIRVVEIMNEIAKPMTDDDLRAFSEFVAKLPPPVALADPAVDTARMQRAQAISVQNRCNFCHQSDYSGHEYAPRLAGQREDYIVKSLRGYKDGSRHGYDQSMLDVVAGIDDRQILDLGYFLARVK